MTTDRDIDVITESANPESVSTSLDYVYHYSEDGTIRRFAPHVPQSNPAHPASVWAIDGDGWLAHFPMGELMRQCWGPALSGASVEPSNLTGVVTPVFPDSGYDLRVRAGRPPLRPRLRRPRVRAPMSAMAS